MHLHKIFTYSFIMLAFRLLIGSSNAHCQELSVETRMDTNRITIGDQIHFSYIFEKKNNLKIGLPELGNQLADGIEIIGEPAIDSTKIDRETSEVRMDMIITAFDTGLYYIPPQPVLLRDDMHEDTLFTRPGYLEVMGVAIDTTYTVRDIKAPQKVPVTFGEVMLYLVPVLLIAILIYLYLVYFRPRRKLTEEIKPRKVEEPPYITALRELDKIKAQKLWQQKHVKEYYTRITYVIRWYIEKRFLINALEQTSDEILTHIRAQDLDDINYGNLSSLLNLADLVKFAKGEPNPEENLIHLDNAYDFIKKTKPDARSQATEEA